MNRLINLLTFVLLANLLIAQHNPFEMPPVAVIVHGNSIADVLYPNSGSQPSTIVSPVLAPSINTFWPQGNPQWQNGYDIKNCKNRISAKIVTERNIADFNFKCSIPFTVSITKEDYSEETATGTLEVYFDSKIGSSFKQIDMVQYDDGNKMIVIIDPINISISGYDPTNSNSTTSLTIPEKKIALESIDISASIAYDKVVDFDPDYRHTYGNDMNHQHIPDADLLQINWNTIEGAIEYDLEWTFTEKEDVGVGFVNHAFDFSNSSSVTISNTSYRLPLTFEQGAIAYRVRGKGVRIDDPSQVLIGNWSCGSVNGACNYQAPINSWLYQHQYFHFEDYLSKKLNWQVVTSYAEDGKRKDVLTYMDGTMRARQTVTAINSDENVLVAETFYDHQGRPAVQSLPAPVHQDMRLKFRQNFNQSRSGSPFSKTDFDLDNPPCGITVNPMSDQSGSAHYYSSEFYDELDLQEIYKNPHHAYIPQSDGYPFVQTEYTADNTGRISRQGGAGPQYQLGSGHETQYFYGVPAQEELDILFGTNVGFANHYKKNMVVDPNGQVSISYLDAKGNTIATALAGKAPEALEQLDSYKPIAINVDLLKLQRKLPTEHKQSAVYNLLVEDQADYTFDYSMIAAQFRDDCMSEDICYNCYYDLHISIVNNQCGTVHLDTTVAISEYLNHPDSINYECSINDLSYQIDTTLNLEIGSYSVTKTLKVNESIANAYVDHYINDAENNCTNKLEEFLLEELDLVDTTDCAIICEDLGPDPESNPAETGWEEMLCDTMPSSPCKVARDLMLADFMPGGQYAMYGDNYDVGNYPLSILNISNSFQHLSSSYNYANIIYPSNEYVLINGISINPATLSVEDYITYYKESWAALFLDYHPESCYLERCWAIETSHQFDISINDVETYDLAFQNGYIDINGDEDLIYIADPYSQSAIRSIPIPNSNLFISIDTYYDALEEGITNYNNQDLSIMQLAIMSTLCPSSVNAQQYLDDTNLFNNLPPSNYNPAQAYSTCLATINGISNLTTEQKDDIWIRYKALYLSIKNRIEYIVRTIHAIDDRCYNECIGQDNFNPLVNNFATFAGNGLGYFDNIDQVCDIFTYPLYTDKQKRFPSMYDILPNMNIDYYDPETPIAHILENIIENVEPSYLEECPDCDKEKELTIILNTIFKDNPLSNPNDVYQHDDLIIESNTATAFSSSYAIHYWNPSGARYFSGLRIVFGDSCDVSFTYPIQESYDVTICGDTTFPITELPQTITVGSAGLENNSYNFQSSIEANSGSKILRTFIECPNENDISEISFVGLHNPTGIDIGQYTNSASLISAYGQDAVVLGEVTLSSNCNTSSAYDFSFNTDVQQGFPVQGINQIVVLPTNVNDDFLLNLKDLSYCDFSNTNIEYYGHLDTITSIAYDQSNSSLTISGNYIKGRPFNITANTSCDYACEDVDEHIAINNCTTLPEAYDLQNFLNSTLRHYISGNGNYYNTSSMTIESNTGLLGEDLGDQIEIESSFNIFNFDLHTQDSSLVIDFYNGCQVFIDLNSQLETINDITILGYSGIEADFNHIDQDGFTNHFNIQYRDKQGNLETTTGYTTGCFQVGYCCTKKTTGGPPKPTWPKPPGPGMPIPYPGKVIPVKKVPKNEGKQIKIGNAKSSDNKVNGKTIGEKKKPIVGTMEFLPIDVIQMEGEILILDIESNRKTPEDYYDLYCRPCGMEVTGGIWRDTIFGRPCEDVWCQDSIPVIYATDLNGQCIDQLYAVAEANAYNRYDEYIDSIRMDVKARYMAQCLNAEETFTGEFAYSQHHFTLYYYDQANNLVQTVPPNGIDTLNMLADLDTMRRYRSDEQEYINGLRSNLNTPEVSRILNSWASEYTYNSLNQLTKQKIPDQGHEVNGVFEKDPTVFWYDDLGRLIASQNPEQELNKEYSYTLYDGLGRIRETGEVIASQDPDYDTQTGIPSQRPISTGYYKDFSIVDADGESYWPTFLSGQRSQITSTTYDEAYFGNSPPIGFPTLSTDNLRGRVSSASYYDDYAALPAQTPDFITHYSYDIHGNVKSLIQKPKDFAHKTIDYDYDLISGNVNYVWYQRDKIDQFTHRYNYDADNRLTLVRTSRDGVIWEEDAHYKYYLHGPLARIELGEDEVQGIDYAYTLQGWIKGMNSASSIPEYDIGKDGHSRSYHENFARDEVGFTLNYNQEDYVPSGANPYGFDSDWNENKNTPDLYNGNIRSMITSIRSFMDDGMPAAYSYTYDQLNRIKSMDHHNDFDAASNSWNFDGVTNVAVTGNYRTSYGYDANGNILTLDRDGMSNGAQLPMDRFEYAYTNGNNRLEDVYDDPNISSNYDNDIDRQNQDNYTYDRLGNLTKDEAEDITNISWNLSGKVSEITKNGGDKITFRYDALGNRIAKSYKDTTTYYIRDASGNTMSTYEAKRLNNGIINSLESLTWQSSNIYGSSRIGQYQPNEMIGGRLYSVPQTPTTGPANVGNGQDRLANANNRSLDFQRGLNQYELTNHLGNVLATAADRKRFDNDINSESEYVVNINLVSDYFPFGEMSKSKFSKKYNFGYNGQLKDNSLSSSNYTAEFWEYDSRIARRHNLDPKPNTETSDYSTFKGNPIFYSDLKGDTVLVSKRFARSKEFKEMQADWKKQTGLNVYVKNGQLEYSHTTYKGSKKPTRIPNEPGSGIAKDQLIQAIDGGKSVTFVKQGYNGFDPENQTISFDSDEIDGLMYNLGFKSNMNIKTIGYGIVSYHEMDHWLNETIDAPMGKAHKEGGITVDYVNLIRSELTNSGQGDFGQRTNYVRFFDRPGKYYLGVTNFTDANGKNIETFFLGRKIKDSWFNSVFRKNTLHDQNLKLNNKNDSHNHDH